MLVLKHHLWTIWLKKKKKSFKLLDLNQTIIILAKWEFKKRKEGKQTDQKML